MGTNNISVACNSNIQIFLIALFGRIKNRQSSGSVPVSVPRDGIPLSTSARHTDDTAYLPKRQVALWHLLVEGDKARPAAETLQPRALLGYTVCNGKLGELWRIIIISNLLIYIFNHFR